MSLALNLMTFLSDGDDVSAGVSLVLFLVSLLFSLAVTILAIAAEWKIFVKAGKPGWFAIVPFLNTYILFDIAYGSGWKMFLMLIPVVGWIASLAVMFRLGQVFGKGTLFNIFAMVIFCFVGWFVIAFDKSEYQGPVSSFI